MSTSTLDAEYYEWTPRTQMCPTNRVQFDFDWDQWLCYYLRQESNIFRLSKANGNTKSHFTNPSKLSDKRHKGFILGRQPVSQLKGIRMRLAYQKMLGNSIPFASWKFHENQSITLSQPSSIHLNTNISVGFCIYSRKQISILRAFRNGKILRMH